MNTLFDVGEEPVPLATPAQIRELVDGYALRKEVVSKWTREKAQTVLARCRKQKFRDESHAAAAAVAQGEEPAGPNARQLVGRMEAAECLGQDLAEGKAEEVLVSLTHAVYALTGGEVLMVARLVKQELELHPETRQPLRRPEAREYVAEGEETEGRSC